MTLNWRKENNEIVCLKSDTCLKAPKTKGIFQNSILEGGDPPNPQLPFCQTFFRKSRREVIYANSLKIRKFSPHRVWRRNMQCCIWRLPFRSFLNMFYRVVHPALMTMIQQSTFWTKPFPCSFFVWGRATGIGASFPSTSDPSPPLLLFLNLRKFLRLHLHFFPTVLGCTGLLWTVMGYTGLYWSVLGCSELNWALMDCTGMHSAAQGCTWLY